MRMICVGIVKARRPWNSNIPRPAGESLLLRFGLVRDRVRPQLARTDRCGRRGPPFLLGHLHLPPS